MSFYDDKPIRLPPSNVSYDYFLSIDNINFMLDSFGMWPGAPNSPAWYFQGDYRTGAYWHGLGQIGFTSLGSTCGVWSLGLLEIWNKAGRKVSILQGVQTSDVSLTLPTASGTLARLEDFDVSLQFQDSLITSVANIEEILFSTYEVYPNTVSVYVNGLRQENGTHVEVHDDRIEFQTDIPNGSRINWTGTKKP